MNFRMSNKDGWDTALVVGFNLCGAICGILRLIVLLKAGHFMDPPQG